MAEVTTMPREDAIALIVEAEFPSVEVEEVEFLSRKVRQGLSFKTALQALVATRKYTEPQEELEEEERKLAAAYQRFGELERLTDDAIQNAAQVVKLKMAAEEREELQLKEETLLNAPRMAAEFEHYRPLAYWDMHEATCLLLGKDPRRLKSIVVFHREGRESSIALSDFPHRSPFAARFRDLANVLKRAAETGVIGDEDRIDPSRLIPWALTRGISVPKALVTAFPQPDAGARQELDDGEIESSTAAPPSSSPDMSTAVPRANLEREVSRLKAQLKTEKPPTLSGEKPRCCCSKDCSMELSEATHGKSLPASRMSSILSTRLLAGASTQILSGRA